MSLHLEPDLPMDGPLPWILAGGVIEGVNLCD